VGRKWGLSVGDCVFDERATLHGRPGVSTRCTIDRAFEVRFSDGSTIAADAEHLWTTTTRQARRRAYRAAAFPAIWRCDGSGRRRQLPLHFKTQTGHRNHALPVATAGLPESSNCRSILCVLGVWLGDGTTGFCQFTTADQGSLSSRDRRATRPRAQSRRFAYIINLETGPGKIGLRRHLPPCSVTSLCSKTSTFPLDISERRLRSDWRCFKD
jgi:hypothetical protein